MKAPTSLFDRPGRAAAVVGAVVAVSASAAVALVSGTAVADEPGRCAENVNVRAEPDITSRIVALCERGTEVQTGESRDGFVQITSLGGWAAQEYVSVNGQPPAPAERESAFETSGEDDNEAGGDAGEAGTTSEDGTGENGTGEDSTGEAGDDESGTGEEEPAEQDGGGSSAPSGGALGGLLG
ncbi:MAG TPA: SH3 domain-containing protein [Pseudonocardia sp.]|nr:SH3 domain-containing protein [Pseudonocardia sp.]